MLLLLLLLDAREMQVNGAAQSKGTTCSPPPNVEATKRKRAIGWLLLLDVSRKNRNRFRYGN